MARRSQLFERRRHPWAVPLFGVSGVLDAIDGWAARKLNQSSELGVLLDVAADNVLRHAMWAASATVDPVCAIAAVVVPSVEWLTFLCTQLYARLNGLGHWKRQSERQPAFVRYFFSNKFRNPLGILGMSGLFLAPVLPYILHTYFAPPPPPPHPPSFFSPQRLQPLFCPPLAWTAFSAAIIIGRLIALAIEVYFITRYLRVLVASHDRGPTRDWPASVE